MNVNSNEEIMTSDTQMDTANVGPTSRRESHMTNKPRRRRHSTAKLKCIKRENPVTDTQLNS